MRNLQKLEGREIKLWMGFEMALTEGLDGSPVIWRDPAIPYMQFIRLDAFLDNDSVCTILSQLDDGSDYMGIYSPSNISQFLISEPYQAGSIYRTREVTELPLGPVLSLDTRTDCNENILEFFIAIGDKTIRVVSGEIHENSDGQYTITSIDESLLVQVLSGA